MNVPVTGTLWKGRYTDGFLKGKGMILDDK